MGELDDKINDLLRSPENLEQIMRLARSFSGQSTQSAENEKTPRGGEKVDTDNAGLGGLGGLDPKLLGLLGSAVKTMGTTSEKDALISAIKPYLKRERQEKIESALQIAKLAKIAKTVIPELGGRGNV